MAKPNTHVASNDELKALLAQARIKVTGELTDSIDDEGTPAQLVQVELDVSSLWPFIEALIQRVSIDAGTNPSGTAVLS